MVARARAHRRLPLFAGVWLGAAAVGCVAWAFGTLWVYELKTIDYRFALRGPTEPPRDVVAVLIDDVTFSRLKLRWPFDRSIHARVIDRIAAARPRAIAYDVQFTERSGTDQASIRQDNALFLAVRRAGNVVLATTEVNDRGRAAVFGGNYRHARARVGNGSLENDRDGVVRRLPLEVAGLRSFALVAAERYLGRPVAPRRGGRQWIDFAGPPGTIDAVSFSDVLRGAVPARVFRDRLVVVGPAVPTLRLGVLPTAAAPGQPMSGAEVDANAASTALHGFPLRSAPRPVDLALIVLLALVPPLAASRLRGWWPVAASAAAAALFLAGAQLAFQGGWIVAVTYPLVALVLATAGALVLQYVAEAVERRTTRDAFSRFVPEPIVEQVLARTDEHLRLGGEEAVGTVMFTDVRGFTTFSEGLPAAEVIDVLNDYLSEMTDGILAHGGTVVTYAGDGIMAVFGAPLAQADHADRAVAAALEMLEVRLPRFNEHLRARGFERPFKMGIGINTGPFMSGNVGSERRLEYTAIGDTINTASRLEGMTKGTPYALFLAESTRNALARQRDDLSFVGEFAVRGRSEPIRLWSISAPAVLKPHWEEETAAPPAAAPAAAPSSV